MFGFLWTGDIHAQLSKHSHTSMMLWYYSMCKLGEKIAPADHWIWESDISEK